MPFHKSRKQVLPETAEKSAEINESVLTNEAYTTSQVWPLVVAILDKDLERNGRTTAVLVSGFDYEHEKMDGSVFVPEGYVTDFASIPGALRVFVSPFGRHAKAAVLHDWLYAVGEPKKKRFADILFRRAMKELGVPFFSRSFMFLAVRLFGGKAYKSADLEWQHSWADWQLGERVDPPGERSEWFSTEA
nr:DUF1353 domain-containing protein [Hyphomonas sp. Mor2]